MKLPILNELETTRDMIDVFAGYNHNLRIGEGEFYDMKNLASTNYPVLSPRGSRGVYATPSNPQGLIAKDSLWYVDGTDFVINGYRVEMGLSTDPKDCPKTLVSMGAYVIIMPDKKWVKPATDDEDPTAFVHGNIEADFTTKETVTFGMCKADGSSYDSYQAYEPDITEEMKNGSVEIPLWLDTSTTPHSLKQYSLSNGMWTTIPTTYVKISCNGICEHFNVNDGVTISGIEIDQLKDLNNTMIIWAMDERTDSEGKKIGEWIVVTGIIDEVVSQDADKPITIKRQMPNMDFIVESENRLWGCRYGVALNGEVVNEIYASKLGDFKNWNCFMGISTDSYAATVGTDGQFTGAITHLGYPIFFKENCMHKVYGNYPANYQISTTTCRGVQKGSHKSLAIVNEVLYYKSRTAVCAYDGSLPQEISYALGGVAYSDAVACGHGNKYYISMHDDTAWHLFVYDTAKGMWHKEDNTRVEDFCSCRGELYYIDNADRKIKTIFGSGEKDASKVEWMAETGVICTGDPDKKYISKLNIRMSLDVGAKVFGYIQYDSMGEWDQLFMMEGTSLRNFTVPIRPRRCDHLRLRIEGIGEAKIYSISKTIEQGSDV